MIFFVYSINIIKSMKMNESHIPYECKEIINGETWYFLSKTIQWLKGSSTPVLINPYKRRCSRSNMITYKTKDQKGKPRVYVNIDGLREIVERTPSVKLSAKRLLGIKAGITSSEMVFEYLLSGFMLQMGHKVEHHITCGEYIIDFVIDGVLAVEYDEMDHCSYEQLAERVRESEIKRNYELIRVSDSDDQGKSIALVYQKLLTIPIN